MNAPETEGDIADLSGAALAVEDGLLMQADDLPADLDPLAEGILMKHQREWLEDNSALKIAEKCRRSGFTFAEALDDAITASTARSEGGSNVFYIGDTHDKGREFIGYCAHFLRVVSKELARVDEFLFEDRKRDGSTKHISAFRITCASGNRIVALSSRPENIRGLQGIVVIDEAAFHKDVGEVIDSALALLIWGGRIRIISTHNSRLNPFHELVARTRAGKTEYSLHSIDFEGVIKNGLYERVKQMKPDIPPVDEWLEMIRGGYTDQARMREELDTIPRDAEGAALSRVAVEACIGKRAQVLRLTKPDDFELAPQGARRREIRDWLEATLRPSLARLDINRRVVIGADMARRGHAATIWVSEISPTLVRDCMLVVEMRKLPFDQMRQVLWFVFEHAGRRWRAAIDASGLGMETAEASWQKYGRQRVEAVSFSPAWYKEHGGAIVPHIGDRTMTVPRDDDVISDLCALAYVRGVVKIPDGHETLGADGGKRHADAAIAAMLAEYASRVEPPDFSGLQSGGGPGADIHNYGTDMRGDIARFPAEIDVSHGTVPSDLDFEGY